MWKKSLFAQITRVFILASAGVMLSGCSLGYVLKSGWYQANLLYGAESIQKVLESDKITDTQRQKLELILDVRRFAQEQIHLDIGKNYTTINLGWKHIIYNVTASKRLAFEPYTWCFLIVGCVMQKGHFVEQDARDEASWLSEQGFDVAVREVGGYSSLGYFRDPVWPQMLERSDASLTDLIIHELAHRTLFFPGESEFNESFANFVGRTGALAYVRGRYGATSAELKAAESGFRDEDRYAKYLAQLYAALDGLYKSDLGEEAKLQRKKSIIDDALSGFSKIPFETEKLRKYHPKEWNNAQLLGFSVYHTGLDDFAALFRCFGGDWSKWLAELQGYRKEKDLFAKLKDRVAQLQESGACGATR